MYSLLPFFIILIENLILSYLTIKHSRKMKKHNLNLSYPMNRFTEGVVGTDSSDLEIKLTLKERIIQKFDKKKRVYRKSVNIHLENTLELVSNNTTQVNNATDNVFIDNQISYITNEISMPISKPPTQQIEKTHGFKKNKSLQTKTSHVANLLLFLTVSFLFTT